MTEVNGEAINTRLSGLSEKMDAIHASVNNDIGEIKGILLSQGDRISNTELRMARLQGAGAALTLGLPFIALALEKVIH